MHLTDMSLNALTFGYLFQHVGITAPLVKKSCVRPRELGSIALASVNYIPTFFGTYFC
jgi:hypothetical protein